MTSPFSQSKSTFSSGDLISFKYSGGSQPGVVRTLHFDSWFWTGQVKTPYMRAKELNGQMKTFNCSKMSDLSLVSQSTSEKKSATKNNLSNWTLWIKKGDIIQFTYLNDEKIYNVTFIEFMDRRCSVKRKILTYEDGYTKILIINKINIHNIFTEDETYNNENSISSSQDLHDEINRLEAKQLLLKKEFKSLIESQNSTIKKLETKYIYLQNECFNLENELQQSYSIMNIHRSRFPLTWDSDFVPKNLSK